MDKIKHNKKWSIFLLFLALTVYLGIGLQNTPKVEAQPVCVPVEVGASFFEIVPEGEDCEVFIRYCKETACTEPVLAQNAECQEVDVAACEAANTVTVSGTVNPIP